MDAWLEGARDVLAETAELAPADLELDPAASATLLDLARIAAHESGKRTNAPLLCYLVGRATARGASLDAVADALRRA